MNSGRVAVDTANRVLDGLARLGIGHACVWQCPG